ncbi:MAG: CxxxxCH/CxxCH domain-containing protein [Deltaproteobacteria bacterium]|nr:CxxxxCH/CxxCH domain-containing protein [Deltaproteobacteria bacterium]
MMQRKVLMLALLPVLLLGARQASAQLPPPPPDTTNPFRGSEQPGDGAAGVPVDALIILCAYDLHSGVDVTTLQVTVNDGGGDVVYSTSSNPLNFAASVNDTWCSASNDGSNANGIKITVTPLANFGDAATVTVTPAFDDIEGNPYAGGSYSFTAFSGAPPPPDATGPSRATENPAPSATGVLLGSTVFFCVYDSGIGVDLSTISVVVNDGSPTTYSASSNPGNFTVVSSDPTCIDGTDGPNSTGTSVTVTPLAAFPTSTVVTVTPSLQDLLGNSYTGGAYTFTTESGIDTTNPTRNTETPAPSATSVLAQTTIVFCAYDDSAGVDVATLQVTVNDGGGDVVYSTSSNASNFVTSVNDSACIDSNDGANPRGVKVTVTPVSRLAYSTTVTVTPAFADQQANSYVGGAYTFQTIAADVAAPTLADANPASGATAVPLVSTVSFCAYDTNSGVNVSTISVNINDGASNTYSAVSNAANFSTTVGSPSCTSGIDGTNPNGVLVTVTPLSAFSESTVVSVTPTFSDVDANAYAGGSYSFTTVDQTPPTRATETPAPSATGVSVSTTVAFCAYDLTAGIEVSTINVTLNDGGGPVLYSTGSNGTNFATVIDSPSCTDGNDGANTRGVLVTVTPLSAFPDNTVVTVTPAFSDKESNAYGGGAYTFTTQDLTVPTRGTETPAPSSTDIAPTTDIIFCVYDTHSGIDVGSISVNVNDGSTTEIYSLVSNPGSYTTAINSGTCTDGSDGANPNGVLVTVTPIVNLAYGTTVTVTPTFSDNTANPYIGGSYTFDTEPPDLVAPWRGSESPGAGASNVPIGTLIRFCAYDSNSGVDVSSISVSVNDGGGPDVYSAVSNPGNFATSVNDAWCTAGNDGANPNGVLVTVTPLAALPASTLITVTPSFSDVQANSYSGGAYTFTTDAGPPPPPDITNPTIADQAPAPLEVDVAVNSKVVFCAYDNASGVDISTISVTLDDGTPVVYSAVSNPAGFTTSVNDTECASGIDGTNPNGVLVTITPIADLANLTTVSVTPSFTDQTGNGYTGGSYTFDTVDFDDLSDPTRGTEVPAPLAESILVDSTIAFCAYDVGWGIDVPTLSVTVDDTTGPVVYSTASNGANFATSVNDAACIDGVDGSNPNGVLVTVTPLTNFPSDVDVVVTPSFSDQFGNTYKDGPYDFHTEVVVDPVVIIMDPAENTTIGGSALIRVFAYYPGNLDAAAPVMIGFGGVEPNWGDPSQRITLTVETLNLGYTGDTTRGVYDLLWNTIDGELADDLSTPIGADSTPADNTRDDVGTIWVRALGADGRAGVFSRSLVVKTIADQPVGDGRLLRREMGSSCRACHDVKTHAAANLDTSYGNWAFGCWDCHAPHGTQNLMLVRKQIQTPNSGLRNVDLRDVTSGVAEYGLAEFEGGANGLNSGTGICEVCHTKTKNPDKTPRYRNTGGGANGGHPESNCVGCHSHASGFSGAGACDGCHNAPPLTASLGNTPPSASVHATHGTATPTDYGQVVSGATAGDYGIPCGKCHPSSGSEHFNGGGSGSLATPWLVQVDGHFDTTENPKAQITGMLAPTFTKGGSLYAEQGPDTKYWEYSNGTCDNVYCHGEFPGGKQANVATFLAGNQPCGACHGADSADPPSGGSHPAHAGGYLGLACNTCHELTVDGGDLVDDRTYHVNGRTDWDLDRTLTRVGLSATYDQDAGGAAVAAETGFEEPPNATYGTCADVYCHSNGDPITGTSAPLHLYQSPTWGGTLPASCLGCHGNDSASGTLIGTATALKGSVRHEKHVGTYGFKCDDCHDLTVESRASNIVLRTGQTTHADGFKSVNFSTWPVDQTLGSWEGTGHTCSDTYCHSSGQQSFGPPNTTADWDNPAGLDCTGCHDNTGMATFAHNEHLAQATVVGITVGCVDCHSATVSNNTTIASTANHVDGVRTVAPAAGWDNNGAASNYTSATKVCSEVYCHGNDSDTGAAHYQANTVDWDLDILGCNGCHGRHADNDFSPSYGAPNHVNGGGGAANANSHSAHVSSSADCVKCHDGTTSNGTSVIAAGQHLNKTPNVSGAYFSGYNSVTKECSNNTCHGNNTVQWGSTLGCDGCHLGVGDNDSYVSGDSKTGRLDSTEWTTYGHGRATAYLSGNAGANFPGNAPGEGCEFCHDPGVPHQTSPSANYFRLRSPASNGTCNVCHDSSDPNGYLAAEVGTGFGAVNGKNVESNHYGSEHIASGGHNGGKQCWDCHDPHGDKSAASNDLWYMVQRQPWEITDANGIPSALAAAIEFRPADGGLNGLAANGLDHDDYVDNVTGLCNNCHDATSAGTSAIGHYTKGASDTHNLATTTTNNRCTDCHSHPAGFAPTGGACDGCHNAPPLTANLGNTLPSPSVHATHSAGVPTSYANLLSGATTADYGIPCGKCHPTADVDHMDNGETGDPGTPYIVETGGVFYDSTQNPKVQISGMLAPTFAAGGLVYEEAGTGMGTKRWRYTNAQCTNVYCHGEFPGGNQANTVTFLAGNQPCGTCHGASQGTPPAGGSHSMHVGTLGLVCNDCHELTVDGTNAVDDRTYHVNGRTDWDLNRTNNSLGASAVYDPDGAGAAVASEAGFEEPPNVTYGQCQSVYCHSNGNPITGGNIFQTPTWGGSIPANCVGCHGDDGTNDAIATGTRAGSAYHTRHVATYGFQCDDCHTDTIDTRASNTTLRTGQTTHMDGAKSVAFTTWPVNQTGGSWSSASHQCTNLYCHSSGDDTPGAPLTPADWDGAAFAGCNDCHDAASATATGLSSAHQKHTETDTYAFPCQRCHGQTVTGSITIASTTLHVNGVQDLYLSGAPNQTNGSGTLSSVGAEGSCSAIYCHSDGKDTTSPFAGAKTVSFGDAGGCTLCHDSAKTAGVTTLSSSHDKHTATDLYGFTCEKCHGQTVDNAATINAATGFGLHVDGNVDWYLRNAPVTADGGGSLGSTCNSIYCHSDGNGTFVASPAWGNNTSCTSCHANTGMATFAHNEHLNQASAVGITVGCVDCHSATVSNNTTISTHANHVDGTKTVAPNVGWDQNGGTSNYASASKQCSAVYCHGNGSATGQAFYETYTVDWDNDTLGCNGCHGRHSDNAFVAVAGEPNHNNGGGGTASANSHQAHVSSAADCVNCHASTTSNGTSVLAAGNHLNKTPNVDGAYFSGYSAVTKTCTNNTCHGGNDVVWGSSLGCNGCHMGAGDNPSFATGDAQTGRIDATEWAASGHGRPSGSYANGENPAANFPGKLGGQEGCEYCHDPSVGHQATGSANYLRLRDGGANTVCTNCHAGGASGVNPPAFGGKDYPLDNATAATQISSITAHYGNEHGPTKTGGQNGGQQCWDCHDPHGDGNWFMIQRNPWEATDANGIPTTTAATVVFTGAVRGGAGLELVDYVDPAAGTKNGLCNNCHDVGGAPNSEISHYTKTTYDSHQLASGQPRCTSCHKHDNDFAGAGGNCMGCHNASQGGRRIVVDSGAGDPGDFKGRSHHVVGSSPTTQVVENWDCIVCHAEGKPSDNGSETASTAFHGNGTVDLLNVDHTSNSQVAGGGPAEVGSGAVWNSGNPDALTNTYFPFRRNDGVDTTELRALDAFCITCHDSDGALYTYNMNPAASNNWHPSTPTGNAGTSYSRQPFGNADLVGSATDQVLRQNLLDPVNNWGTGGGQSGTVIIGGATRGNVIDVKTQFDPTGSHPPDIQPNIATGNSTTWTKYSYHALVFFGVSRYSTTNAQWASGGFAMSPIAGWDADATCRNKDGSAVRCDDTKLMFCSDCHRSAINSHGAQNAEYLLSCEPGATGCSAVNTPPTHDDYDVAGTFTAANNVCYRCHEATRYTTNHQDGASSDFLDVVGQPDFNSRVGALGATDGSLFGLGCHNCHGGTTFGAIHGSSETITPVANNVAATSRRAWRFMNGSSQSEFRPSMTNTANDTGRPNDDNARWSGSRTYECFTLSTSPDRTPLYGGCNNHGGGARTAVGMTRTLNY